jgi:hypothetical protein
MNKKKVGFLIVVFALGFLLANSNYDIHVDLVEAGEWVDIPIELEYDQEQFTLAGTSNDYIDAWQSTTYGTYATGPPSGMGTDSNGPSGDTHLTEASFSESSFTTVTSYTGGSRPSGWTDSGFDYSMTWGASYVTISGTDAGPNWAQIITNRHDMSSYDDTRIKFRWRETGEAIEAGDFYVDARESGGYITVWTCPSSQSSWTDVTIDRTWAGSGWDAKFYFSDIDWSLYPDGASETYELDNIYLQGKSSNTYYRFQMVFKWTGVDTAYKSATLYIDFYTALTGSDDLDFYFEGGDSTPDHLIQDNAQNDFNVDVTSYLYGASTIYLDIRDDYRSGDSVQTTAYIQRCYLVLSNNPPSSSTFGSFSNLLSGTILAEYNYVTQKVNVTDTDGYANLDYVEYSMYENARSTEQWSIRWTQATDSFAEHDTPARIVLGTCSSQEIDSNTRELTFNFTIDFDYYIIVGSDMRSYVYDDVGESSTTWYEAGPDTEDRVQISTTMNDGSGTIDRGNIGGTFTANGTVSYYGFSSYYPYDIDSAFVRVSSVDVSGGPWDSADYDESDGSFSATVDADSSVGQDTYTFTFYQSGSARTNTETDTYIADRVIVRSYNNTAPFDPYVLGWPTPHIDVSGAVTFYFEIEYEYDSTDVSTGTWTETGISSTYDTGGKWNWVENANTVALYTYNTVAGSDTTHGINVVNQDSKQLQVIGDRMILMASYNDADNRAGIRERVLWTVWLQAEYGSENITACEGGITWNGLGYHDGGDSNGLFWVEIAISTVQNKTFDTIAAITHGGSAPGYYLYTVNQNGISAWCIYDRILVANYTVSDTHVNLNDDVTPQVTLIYDFDDTAVTGEDVWVNGYECTELGSGDYEFASPISRSTVGTIVLDDVDIAGNNNAGIPDGYWTFSNNGQSVTIIWDKIQVTMSANMTWVYIGYYAEINATAMYQYDGASSDCTITVNTTLSDNEDVMYETVGLRSWLATGVSGDSEGITAFDTTTASVIWDAVVAPSTNYYWTQEDIFNVWMHMSSNVWVFEYDSDPLSEWSDDVSRVQAYINGTANEYGIIDAVGNLYTLAIGPFGPTWYYVNVSLYWTDTVQGRTYNIYVKSFVAPVDILHSIHIEDSGMDIQDAWITFIVHTNWGNASFTVWDNDTLVGHSATEGWYQIAKPSVVGLHNYTVLINGSHGAADTSSQIKDWSTSDSWEWRNMKFTVNPVTLSVDEVMIQQNNETVVVTARVFTPVLSMSYWVYEASVLVDSGGFTVAESGSYFSVWWEKASAVSTANWSLTIGTGSSNVTVPGFNVVVDSADYITTNNASNYEDNRTTEEIEEQIIVEGDFVQGDTPETAAFETLSMIVYAIALPGVGAIFYFLGKGREKRRRVQPDVTRGTGSARSLTGQRGARTRQ